MARIRSIPPDVATDPKLLACSMPARLLAILAWPWHDDHGCIAYDPVRIRLNVFPNDVETSVAPLLDELLASGWFELYESPDGKRFLWCSEFKTYQRVVNPSAPKFAPIKDSRRLDSPNKPSIGLHSPNKPSQALAPSIVRMDGWSGAEADGVVVVKEREGAEADGGMLAMPREPANGARPAPLADAGAEDRELPAKALELLRQLTEAKRKDGERQLRATLTPQGALLGKGEYVRAWNADHLAHCCDLTLKSRPDDADLLVRWVLLKLRDSFLEWKSAAEKRLAPAVAPAYTPPAISELDATMRWLEGNLSVAAEIERLTDEQFDGFPDTNGMQQQRKRWREIKAVDRWRDAGSPIHAAAHGAADPGGSS
jgi:hypothetical protein